MIDYKIFKRVSDTWEELPCTFVLPFSLGFTLDESLDSGKVDLVSDTKIVLTPFTLVKILVTFEDTTTKDYYFFVGSTSTMKKNMSDGTLYNISVELIELTKALERNYLQTITFTKPLDGVAIHPTKYVPYKWANASEIAEFGHPWGYDTYKESISDGRALESHYYSYTEVEPNDVIKFSKLKDIFTVEYKPPKNFVFSKSRYFYQLSDNDGWEYPQVKTNDGAWEKVTELTAGAVGTEYTVRYVGFIMQDDISNVTPDRFAYYKTFIVTTTIKVVEKVEGFSDWDIASVTKRVMEIAQVQEWKKGQLFPRQVIQIDNAFLERYSGVNAPDFSFTNTTLFEALLQIGKVINSIPRLTFEEDHFVLKFDNLGSNVSFEEPTEIGEESSLMMEDYASDIIIPSQSVVNTLGDGGGVISDLSLRTTEGEILIDADTGIAMTQYPIYRVEKVVCNYVYTQGGSNVSGSADITKYVVEKAVYDLLNPYVTSGTSAKSLRLYYIQNSRNIYGLNYNGKGLDPTLETWQTAAIINILRNIKPDLSNVDESNFDYTQFRFYIKYIPSFEGRISQNRDRAFTYGLKNDLLYNQASNIAETKSLSRNILGAAQRMGNESLRKTYIFDNWDENDFIGHVKDINGKRMYVSDISVRYEKDHITSTFTYTQNFNRLNAYTSLDSQHRLYEIDEKQSVRRDIPIKNNIYVAASADLVDSSFTSSIAYNPLSGGLGLFDNEVGYMQARLFDDKDTQIGSDIIVPVVKNAIGNSVWLHAEFLDNYGAGYQATKDNIKPGEKKMTQRLVPYTDSYGRVYKMKIDFTNELNNSTVAPEDTSDPYFDGDLYKEIYVNKDSREALSFDYQIQYAAKGWDGKVEVLPGWAENNPVLVGFKPLRAACANVVRCYDDYVNPYTGDMGKEPIAIKPYEQEGVYHQYSRIVAESVDGTKDRVLSLSFFGATEMDTTPMSAPPTNAKYFYKVYVHSTHYSTRLFNISQFNINEDNAYIFFDENKNAIMGEEGVALFQVQSRQMLKSKKSDRVDVNLVLIKDPTIKYLYLGTDK